MKWTSRGQPHLLNLVRKLSLNFHERELRGISKNFDRWSKDEVETFVVTNEYLETKRVLNTQELGYPPKRYRQYCGRRDRPSGNLVRDQDGGDMGPILSTLEAFKSMGDLKDLTPSLSHPYGGVPPVEYRPSIAILSTWIQNLGALAFSGYSTSTLDETLAILQNLENLE